MLRSNLLLPVLAISIGSTWNIMLLAQYVSHIPIHLFNFALTHTHTHAQCNYASAGVPNNPNPFEQPLTANFMMLFVV